MRFFQIKNGFLYWYKSKEAQESQNRIELKHLKNVSGKNKDKLMFLHKEKIYKFKCENEAERDDWVKCLNAEIKRVNSTCEKNEKFYEEFTEVKLKKKIIEDFFNLPKIQEGKDYIIRVTEKAIKEEGFFPPKPKK